MLEISAIFNIILSAARGASLFIFNVGNLLNVEVVNSVSGHIVRYKYRDGA